MQLQELLKKATVTQTKLLKKTVEWTQFNDTTGEDDELTADVHIVTNLKFAAQERIVVADAAHADVTQWSRAISERLRFGEDGTEQMTFEQARDLHPNLGWALVAIIMAYQDEQKALQKGRADDRAKKLSQMTSSGTNSSSTESAAKQSQKPKS